MKNSELTYKEVLKDNKLESKTLRFPPSDVTMKWSEARKISAFRWKLLVGTVVFSGILISFPFFFNAIENRNGYVFPDFILDLIPAHNYSVAVFFLIWSCCLLLVIRIYGDPQMLLVALWAYDIVTLVRMASIGVISLNPPVGL